MDYIILPYTSKEKKDKRWVMEVTECKLVAHDVSVEVAKQMVEDLRAKQNS